MSTANEGTERFLAGRTAVVTGGGRGIGRATALALTLAGAGRVGVIGRTGAQLEETAAMIRDAGGQAVVFVADLLRLDTLTALAERLGHELGRVDVLVNNAAAVAPLGRSDGLDPEQVVDAFRLNVVAPVTLSGRLLPGMVERGWGRIVNISTGVVAHPEYLVGGSTYVATKAALEAQSRSLAAEYAGTGVTVNAYRPGQVDTAMQAWIRAQDPDEVGRALHDRFVHAHDAGMLLTPERSARALVSHLRSDDTGVIWDVDETI